MIKNIIIGAGFSAAVTKILIGKDARIIGSLDHINAKNKNLLRRKSIECNKIFSKKTFSYGTLDFNLKNGKLHDRLTLGGNSSIWGGKINLKKIPTKIIKLFKKKKIFFKKLSFNTTGTISNNKNISQLQIKSGEILQTQHLPIKIQNGYLESFFINKNKIYIIIKNSKNLKSQKINVKNLFLCIGSVQLLDLLYRSKFLKEKDIIEFSEFYHKYKWNFINSPFKKNATTVRYHFCRALGHFFGIQSFSKFLKLLKFIPICVDQNFYKKKLNYKLHIKNGIVLENINKKNSINFGQSIHYCNMKINNISINNFLSKINPNIFGGGMSFINQKEPGPISNEIILDIHLKLAKLLN